MAIAGPDGVSPEKMFSIARILRGEKVYRIEPAQLKNIQKGGYLKKRWVNRRKFFWVCREQSK